MLLKRLRLTLDMLKFEHSILALPFALTGALLAFREGGYQTAEIWGKLGWIVVAMVGARSAAMAFNRLVDARIDAKNPRTAMRPAVRAALLAASPYLIAARDVVAVRRDLPIGLPEPKADAAALTALSDRLGLSGPATRAAAAVVEGNWRGNFNI